MGTPAKLLNNELFTAERRLNGAKEYAKEYSKDTQRSDVIFGIEQDWIRRKLSA